MGCDIHAYIDYDDPDLEPVGDYWQNHCEHFADVSIGRNYLLFGILAGVRMVEPEPVHPRRGLPEKVSWQVEREATLYVSDAEDYDSDEEGTCSRECADGWNASWERSGRHGVGGYLTEEKKRIHHPDWHSHSWLTTEEVRLVIHQYKQHKEHDSKFIDKNEDGSYEIPDGYELDILIYKDDWLDDPEYKMVAVTTKEPVSLVPPSSLEGVLGAMEGLEKSGKCARFVFWFDN